MDEVEERVQMEIQKGEEELQDEQNAKGITSDLAMYVNFYWQALSQCEDMPMELKMNLVLNFSSQCAQGFMGV